jgi:hypothetical protein
MLRRLSRSKKVTIFDKTFNVVNLNPEPKRLLQNRLPLLIALSVLVYFLGFYLLAHVTGYLLGICVAILCLNLMMVGEAYELHKDTSVFARALKSGADLGEGDMRALLLLNHSLPKLAKYYLLLTALFVTSFVAHPYLESATVLLLSSLASAVLAYTPWWGLWSAFVGMSVVATLAVTFMTIAGIVKRRIFDFSSLPTEVLREQFEQNTLHQRWGGRIIIGESGEKRPSRSVDTP